LPEDSLAVVDLDRIKPHHCNYECVNYCPPNRAGKPCITLRREADEPERLAGKPEQVRISEEICLGEKCGICVHKCPFDAIKIINLPSELDENPIHRYGENAFKLYGLPAPKSGKVTGILGPNGIGKTTFAELLAGHLVPDDAGIDLDLKVAYNPQYIDLDWAITVKDFLRRNSEDFGTSYWDSEIAEPLKLDQIKEQELDELSGGEHQRVAIAACLSEEADIYLFDEPSAQLDVEQRVLAIRAIRRHSENKKIPALVIDHDIYLIDLIADRLQVFEGVPGEYGNVHQPLSMHEGMNEFLKDIDITFRRDPDTGRPRINKPGSRKDREQKKIGEYYYV